jgi:hypothetical protein
MKWYEWHMSFLLKNYYRLSTNHWVSNQNALIYIDVSIKECFSIGSIERNHFDTYWELIEA